MTHASAAASAPAASPPASADAPPRTLGPALRVFLRYFSPRVLLTLTVVSLAWRASLGSFTAWDAAIVFAWWALWPIQEWLIHVLILHWKPKQILGRRVDLMNAAKHRAHHADPTNIAKVFVPWFTVVSALPVLVAAALLILPTVPLAATTIAAYLVFALHYEWAHYLSHVPYTPKLGYYQRICKAHTLHHYRSEKHWWGVSRTFGDVLFRTEGDPRTTPASDTVRTLGVE